MIQAQRGLDGFAIQRTNRQPACGPGRERQLKRGEWFHGSGREPSRTHLPVQCQQPNEHHGARAKHKPKHCQQHQRNRVHRIHTLNLRPRTAGSNKICLGGLSSRAVAAPAIFNSVPTCDTECHKMAFAHAHNAWLHFRPATLRRSGFKSDTTRINRARTVVSG